MVLNEKNELERPIQTSYKFLKTARISFIESKKFKKYFYLLFILQKTLSSIRIKKQDPEAKYLIHKQFEITENSHCQVENELVYIYGTGYQKQIGKIFSFK